MDGSALEKNSLTLHSHLYIIRDQLQGMQNCIIPAQSIKRGIAKCTIINTDHRQQQSWSREKCHIPQHAKEESEKSCCNKSKSTTMNV